MHLVPVEEPHELGLGCPCRPVTGWRVVRAGQIAVVEHRSARERWRGAQGTARPARQPELDGGPDA